MSGKRNTGSRNYSDKEEGKDNEEDGYGLLRKT